MPWYIRMPLSFLSPIISTTPSDCGTLLLSGFLDQSRKTGWHLMNNYGDNVKPTSGHDDAIRENVFNWTNSVIS